MADTENERCYASVGFYGNGRNFYDHDGAYCFDRPVGKESFELQQRISHLESENSLLRSEQAEDKKLVDLFKALDKKIGENEKVDERRWADQLVHNARQDVRLEVLEREVHQLYSMTGLYVRAEKVTPRPMIAMTTEAVETN